MTSARRVAARTILAATVMLMAGRAPVFGQTNVWPVFRPMGETFSIDRGPTCIIYSDLSDCGGGMRHQPTGNADLDRAVAICDAHPNRSATTIPVWPPYDSEWKACGAVYALWEVSDVARRDAERAAKEAADKTWLENYVRTLK